MRGGIRFHMAILPTAPMTATRILLSEAASRHLDAIGEDCFVVTSFDRSDERSGRWVLHLIPCTLGQANSAVRVATGQSTERRTKTKKA